MSTLSDINVIIPVFFSWVLTWYLFSIFLLSASLSPFIGGVCTYKMCVVSHSEKSDLSTKMPHFRSWGLLYSDFLLSVLFFFFIFWNKFPYCFGGCTLRSVSTLLVVTRRSHTRLCLAAAGQRPYCWPELSWPRQSVSLLFPRILVPYVSGHHVSHYCLCCSMESAPGHICLSMHWFLHCLLCRIFLPSGCGVSPRSMFSSVLREIFLAVGFLCLKKSLWHPFSRWV